MKSTEAAPVARLIRAGGSSVSSRMKTRNVIILIGLALLAGAACVTWWSLFYTPLGHLVRGQDFEGIILDPTEYCAEQSRLANTWKITSDDIVEMETMLRQYVHDNQEECTPRFVAELPSYRRHYFGVMHEGEKSIKVSFFHNSAVSRHEWLRYRFSVVFGGGDYFCDITYNISSRTFGKFECNSPW